MNYEGVPLAEAVLVSASASSDPSLMTKLSELEAAKSGGYLGDEAYESTKRKLLQNFSQGAGGATEPSTSKALPSAPLSEMVMERHEVAPRVIPTNVFRGKQHFANILCPIAGHPDFDKGAYQHPLGLCCYTLDRKSTINDDPVVWFFWPLTLACYVGTLAYQPCGCMLAGKVPWLGDCPYSEQRVTDSFVTNHPTKVTRTVNSLVLTLKGSPNQCVFEGVDGLRNGRSVPLVLLSHSEFKITKEYTTEKKIGPWRYIESNCTDGGEAAIQVRLEDGEYLKLKDCDLVLDVTMWKYEVGTTVNFVGGSDGPSSTKKPGGGRSWIVNDNGTISLKHDPNFVLGV